MSHTVYDELDCDPKQGRWIAKRLLSKPIVHASLDSSIGVNIQGPSLIRVPDWVASPLGRYYLYFADHKGRFIRLAYADELQGPWRIHVSGSLHLENSLFPTEPVQPVQGEQGVTRQNTLQLLHSQEYEGSTPHIASPDVHVNHDERRIYMYYHGLLSYANQKTRVATSVDGIDFVAEGPILCSTYLRVVPLQDTNLGMVMPGVLFRMNHLRGPFENGQQLFTSNARHHALLKNRDRLFVFWSEVGEAPEHIKVSAIEHILDGNALEVNHLGTILKPELDWEGVNAPNEPSVRSVAYGCVNQLRDPCIFVEKGRIYLLYAGGGESAIGITEISWEQLT